LLKTALNVVAVVAVFPCVALCWLESRFRPDSEVVFNICTHVLALSPGFPGIFFRRAFYRLTLENCGSNCTVGFGAFFSHRTARVEDDVYVGPYAVVGSANLGAGCLIGTRVSLLSGLGHHQLGDDGKWHLDPVISRITIGPNVWIGEAALVMADVGQGTLVAAGAVVSSPVAAGVVVAGNPARFVRHVRPAPAEAAAASSEERGRESFVHSSH
jgi:virginiamycin A acetyltransferase